VSIVPAHTTDPTSHATTALDPFVCELARSWQRDAPELSERDLRGSLVFADISGFTRLTERLAARGRIGAEEMSDHLDRVLSELLAAAYERGGWLLKWGGDALLLMFDGVAHVERACAASIELRSLIRTAGVLDTSVGRVRLQMSIGIHTGDFSFHFLGHRHREVLVTGTAATTTAALEAAAEPGEILVSPQIARLLPASSHGPRKGPGFPLVRAPATAGVESFHPLALDVGALIPELVLDHLRDGGGSGEHRPVTVAFIEFSGMSELRRRDGPVAVAAALRHFVEVTQEACHRNLVSFHETDISRDGGKVMLVAGAPRGLDDPAEAMLCTLRQVFDDPGSLPLRAGVTAGRAFTGVVGPARRRSYSVKGDVVNLAARVMGKAPPGEIWALPVVVETSRTSFALGDVPRFAVKGKVAPVLVRSVGHALARVDLTPELPLIGRTAEIEVLRTAFDDACAGRGSHIDLIGAAGIGKTRLLAELTAAAGSATVLAAAAEPYRSSSPYALTQPLVLQALGLEEVEPAKIVAALSAFCREHAPDLLPQLPLLGPLLGATISDTPQTRDLAPEFRADRMQQLVVELLEITLRDPALLVVDDMQFADEASEALLRRIAHVAAAHPWLVVLAGREEPPSTELSAERSRTIVLGPMSLEESIVLAGADTDDAPLAPHVTDTVVRRSGGNPSFLRQLAAAAHTVSDIDQLPDSIETVVAARIDRLRPLAREVLRAMSVAGMTVDHELLDELLADESTRPATVLPELDEYVSSDGTELRFRQAIIRDTAYEGLAYRRRTALHARLASLLAERHAGDTSPVDALLSVHYLHGAEHAAALHAARIAADRAADAFANADAAVLYARALTAASRLQTVDDHVRSELLERLGDVQVLLGEYRESDANYAAAIRRRRAEPEVVARIGLKQARSAADRRGAYDLALRRLRRVETVLDGVDGPEAVDLRLAILVRTAFARFRQGRLAAAREHCRAVLENGDDDRNPNAVADALALLEVVEISLGEEGDLDRAPRALRLNERLGDLAGQARVLTQIGYREYFLGHWDEAVSSYSRARELIERVGDLPNAALASANIAEILLDQGRLDQAEATLRESVRISRASGSENDAAFAHALLGRTLARQGEFDEAERFLRRARASFAEQGAKSEVVDADAYLAEWLLLSGQPAEALALAERTRAAADRLSERPVQAPLLQRIIAASHDALGDAEMADLAYDTALELARARGADHEISFTISAMVARTRHGRGYVDSALIEECRQLQQRLGLVLDLSAAERLPEPLELPRQEPAAEVAAVIP
jgi:class 3 adenylate cyclase/tetratricopeptide (TPR) repeat protein